MITIELGSYLWICWILIGSYLSLIGNFLIFILWWLGILNCSQFAIFVWEGILEDENSGILEFIVVRKDLVKVFVDGFSNSGVGFFELGIDLEEEGVKMDEDIIEISTGTST